MKLLVAGNLVNSGYHLTKLLRNEGFATDLLLKKNPSVTEEPKSLEGDLLSYPEWIKFWDGSKRNWKYNIIKIMRKYDLVQASTEFPIFSLFSLKPFIVFTTGSDIIELAHKNSVKGFLLRLAYKKAKLLIFPGPYMYDSVKKLKIKNAIFIPLLWDYDKFNTENNLSLNNPKFTIFHPTRHSWKIKGNDIFLKAFIKLAEKRKDVHLYLINHGEDFDRSLQLLKKPTIKGKFTVLPRLKQNELLQYYKKCDVVVDYFVLGSMGMIGQEALACKKPLIQYFDQNLNKKFYDELPPIIGARNGEQIFSSLSDLIEDREMCRNIGMKSREWLLKYHNPKKIIKKYIYVYESVQNHIKFNVIKENLASIGN